LATLAYVAMLAAAPERRLPLAVGLGGALGLAFLSKYAAIYFVVGLALHLALSREARRAWRPVTAGAALLALGAVLAPNLAWNAAHGFATFQHTAENAAWSGVQLFNLTEMGAFLGSQFGVFGPIPMGALIVGVGLAVRRRGIRGEDLLLLCFTLPPLLIVTGQAFISRANANWSGAAYLTGAILVAAWLMRWRARGWLRAAIAIQAGIAAFFLAAVVSPALADKVGLANGLKRARGWSDTADLILDRAWQEPGLTAIAVNNRFLYYATAYYGRTRLAERGVPLTSWLLMEGPRNQAETAAPLTPELGGRVLMVSYEGWRRAEMQADFTRASGLEIGSVRLDDKRRRRVEMFLGEGFVPAPRDPVSGLPRRP
ncbi:MAG: 4-amino-4-deoxy-L-arabinose transferase, partial [Phenylobacterium sp.]|nr:4-amino-4-deoxy-L-arabinose transferase [Phenylobacterium sp.]